MTDYQPAQASRDDSDDSRYRVAFQLMERIAQCEGIKLHKSSDQNQRSATRDWILRTYAQCIRATHGQMSEKPLRKIEPV